MTYPLGAAVTLFAPSVALMTGVREVGGAAIPRWVFAPFLAAPAIARMSPARALAPILPD